MARHCIIYTVLHSTMEKIPKVVNEVIWVSKRIPNIFTISNIVLVASLVGILRHHFWWKGNSINCKRMYTHTTTLLFTSHFNTHVPWKSWENDRSSSGLLHSNAVNLILWFIFSFRSQYALLFLNVCIFGWSSKKAKTKKANDSSFFVVSFILILQK